MALIVTGLIGTLALLGAQLPVVGYVLFPGGMAAWAYKGDNYTSETFLQHTVVFALLLNVVAGAAIGLLVAWVSRFFKRTNA